jgi:uncharacterized membrane protein
MKTLLPPQLGLSFLLILVQTYLLVYFALMLMRGTKLLKRPYSGMEYSEALLSAIILLGVVSLSTTNVGGLFQTVRFYSEGDLMLGKASYQFFARTFMIILFFCFTFIGLIYLNRRIFFPGQLQSPSISINLLHCSIAIGLAIICWLTASELIGNMVPKIINFQ